MSHKHCVFCGIEVPVPRPTTLSLQCDSPLNNTTPDTFGRRYHAVIIGTAKNEPPALAIAPCRDCGVIPNPMCKCTKPEVSSKWPHKAGGIIDAWDMLPNDLVSDIGLENLGRLINEMRKEIESAAVASPAVPVDVLELARKHYEMSVRAASWDEVTTGTRELWMREAQSWIKAIAILSAPSPAPAPQEECALYWPHESGNDAHRCGLPEGHDGDHRCTSLMQDGTECGETVAAGPAPAKEGKAGK